MGELNIAALIIQALLVGVAAVIVCSFGLRSQLGKLSIAGFLAGLLLLAANEARISIRRQHERESHATNLRMAASIQQMQVWNMVKRLLFIWDWRLKEWCGIRQSEWNKPEELWRE